ncbi:MAG: Lipoprotein-releasing system ATP-binding protein LolD [Candidatus Anoxychlamydiales bacterium]|nr:Lipoprotein-releasing system ATP-binding protein LolD [Candidatus Anoxychlamydiales bacterium]NGX52688.1 Lipoprotein-releasing system ATP-binding protein LolD [Candidatus Anoxychlamydiales bacterium]
MKEVVLKAVNLHKSYKTFDDLHILKGISLTLKQNESIAIMGSSGAGKTTLLHILGTLETFDSGKINILNSSAKNNEIRNKHIGFIFQAYNLIDDLTLLENVLMPALIARKNILPNSTAYKRALNLLKEVGLTKRKNHLAKELSGGEKQRATIARAFLNDPDIILADEPSGNLDFKNSEIIHKLLIDSVKKYNKSLIIATHDKKLAALCDKIYHLENGNFLK